MKRLVTASFRNLGADPTLKVGGHLPWFNNNFINIQMSSAVFDMFWNSNLMSNMVTLISQQLINQILNLYVIFWFWLLTLMSLISTMFEMFSVLKPPNTDVYHSRNSSSSTCSFEIWTYPLRISFSVGV